MVMIICFFFNILLLMSRLPFIYSTSNSFCLKLVHSDSPNSPLYQPNLSNFQRFKKNAELSISRASHFQQRGDTKKSWNSTALQNKSLRFQLHHTDSLFTVDLRIGTPAVKTTLIFDTGSDITWTQCQPCVSCFKQNLPIFNPKNSTSYKTLSRNNELSQRFSCVPLFGCFYSVAYYSGQSSTGIGSLETFTFQGTTAGRVTKVKGLVFGCGNSNRGSFDRSVTGLLAMDRNPVSFARQLGGQIMERFSYCLPTIQSSNSTTKDSYVRFGKEAVIRGRNAQSTPFQRVMQNLYSYRVSLIDISIAGKRLGLKRGTFGRLGCVIDSGASFTLIHTTAYNAAMKLINGHFSKFRAIKRFYSKYIPKEMVCYTRPIDFQSFLNMTFHFEGADYHVPPRNLFWFGQDPRVFCLGIIASKTHTLLGAYQQQNVRLVYDLKGEMLGFAPEDCSKDAAR